MIGIIDCNLQAAHPEMPLHPMMAFINSPSSIRLRDVPKRVGDWNITKVYFQASYPDDTIKSVNCTRVGNIWVGTVEGSTVSGKSQNGFTVLADGVDENGNPVVGYVLGKGDIYIYMMDNSISPDTEAYYVHFLEAVPESPKKGDCVVVDDSFQIYDGEKWVQSGQKVTKLSELENDVGFVDSSQLTSICYSRGQADLVFAAKGDVPTQTSQLTNDSGFLSALSSHHVSVADTTVSDASRGNKYQTIQVKTSGGKKMVYGMCTDQANDGTGFIGGLFADNATAFPYAQGLAIGGTSGNLLWKGKVVATKETTLAGYGITDAVKTSGDQTISGAKTFAQIKISPDAGIVDSKSSNWIISRVQGSSYVTSDVDEVWVGQQQCKFITRGVKERPVYRKYTGSNYVDNDIALKGDIDSALGDVETILARING